MLPERPRPFLGTHETRTHLKGVLSMALYHFYFSSLLNSSTYDFHIEILVPLFCVTSQSKKTKMELFSH